MILQALVAYYDRERARPDSEIAPPGWIRRALDYELVLAADGRCLQAVATFRSEKNRKIGRPSLLPFIGKQALKHTNSGTDANLLWDNASFVLGRGKHGAKKLQSFGHALQTWFGDIQDEGVTAVQRFVSIALASPDVVTELLHSQGLLEDFDSRDPIVAFRLESDGPLPVHERPGVLAAYEAASKLSHVTSTRGLCLVTGQANAPLASNETVIKGVWKAQPAGANIVSFNARAFVSFGKSNREAECAPISSSASAAYSTSLNHLLASDRQRVQVGDASTVFWADRASRFDGEFSLADFFGDADDPTRSTRAVQALFEALRSGQVASAEGEARFFVLGLAPNQGRLSVRFWLHAPLSELAPRIARHFRDLAIVRQFDSDPAAPSLSRLLRSLALQERAENVPPRLAGEWMRAILEGRPYPVLLLNAVVQRCRAEQATRDARGNVSYLRAAMLKAWLNREHRRRHPDLPPDFALFKEELDMDQTDAPYRLGRLFALLERLQQQAQGSVNAGIRDRYYGAASTTPVAVFPTLLRLKNAHLKKLGTAQEAHFERQIGEVCGSLEAPALNDFPSHLSLAEQGRFALGYYHQRQSFFARRAEAQTATPTDTPEILED